MKVAGVADPLEWQGENPTDPERIFSFSERPDGDAIGSELGLARLLRRMGKGAVVWNRDATPTVYMPLPGSARIHSGQEPPAGFPDAFDGIFVLECPSLDRTGLDAQLAAGAKPIVNTFASISAFSVRLACSISAPKSRVSPLW